VRAADRSTCTTSLKVIEATNTFKVTTAIDEAKSIQPLLDKIQRKDLAQSAGFLVGGASSVGANASGNWRSNDEYLAFSSAALDVSKLCAKYYLALRPKRSRWPAAAATSPRLRGSSE
jgi:hypothetical protein